MLLERDRKLFYLFAVISIALSLLVCIPLSLVKVTLFEIILKYMIIPCAIVVFTFTGWSAKYRSYRPAVKFTNIVTYAPLFSYGVAIVFNTLLILVRQTQVYDSLKYNVLIIGLAAILVLMLVLSQVYSKFVIKLSKNEALVADGIFAVLVLAYTFGGMTIAFDSHSFGGFESKSIFFVLLPLILGIASAWLHILILGNARDKQIEYVVKNRQELYELWENNRILVKNAYNVAKVNLLESLLNYNLEELGFEEVEGVDEDVEEVSSNNEELENKVKSLEEQANDLNNQYIV